MLCLRLWTSIKVTVCINDNIAGGIYVDLRLDFRSFPQKVIKIPKDMPLYFSTQYVSKIHSNFSDFLPLYIVLLSH